jgi:glycosyltransferase involved in cell wall biosynthesis
MKQFNNLRIALVHDYIKEYGGAERVLEELHKLYPEAPIYTAIYAPENLGSHRANFEDIKVIPSFLQYIPFNTKLISIFRLIAPLVFMSFNLSDYDVVITSAAGTYTSPNYITKGEKTKLICYCHTPPRYLYGYKTANDWDSKGWKRLLKAIGTIPMHFLRLFDFQAAQKPDYFIANSEEIKARIQKFYRRDATVINPPVDIPTIKTIKKENYYLAGGRLARAKGIDVIVDAFAQNGKPLKIFGRGFAGFEEELLAKIKGKKTRIEFVGEVTDEERTKLMAGAKAYVFASYDEDFGITPLEAQACGTAVISFRSGGVKETVIDGKTGIFYDENIAQDLNEAIGRFEKTKISADACKKNAEKFSAKVFDKKIREFVEKHDII